MPKTVIPRLVAAAAWAALALPAVAEQPPAPPLPIQLDAIYSDQVQPILAQHCYDCHGPDTQESDLRLDSFAAMAYGGLSGPVVTPGKPAESMLYAAVTHADEALQMPPGEKISATEIATLKEWIALGAPHPEEDASVFTPPQQDHSEVLAAAAKLWSFQPITRPAVPQDGYDVRTPVDAFIQSEQKEQGLQPVSLASRAELIRRATYDLIGLPPTPEEIDAFVNDPDPNAFAKVVDRLLDSPQYGERWGRHWLDVARYADSNGLDENVALGTAWRYRDYVVAAFNNDKPYNRFVLEQIAGDLLDEGRETQIERETATAFLSLGPKVLAEQDKVKLDTDIVDEQIDTMGRAMLGLTLGCARCHDHKFDPILTADYYSLAGIFHSTQTMIPTEAAISRWNENVIATAQQERAHQLAQERVAAKDKEIKEFIDRTNAELFSQITDKPPADAEKHYPKETRDQLQALRKELATLKEQVPELPTVIGVTEGDAGNTRIHVRGSHLTLGRTVERGVPVALKFDGDLPVPAEESGRLQLAKWLVDPENPLTARVIVNRLWHWHFGEGLVSTPDNFGRLGARPVNQPLLDWLASEFVASGWSIKQMHRTIMLSRTYQLSSDDHAGNLEADPENTYHWRAPILRLEAEEVRDSLLAVSGLLEHEMGGSLLHVGNREFIFNHTSKDETNYSSMRRSLYLPVIRNNLYTPFSLFDYTDASVVCGNRPASTIAPQALFMLNSDLLLTASDALARRVLTERPHDASAQVQRLYKLVFGRSSTEAETDRIESFVKALSKQLTGEDAEQQAWSAACQVLLASNEFLYVK